MPKEFKHIKNVVHIFCTTFFRPDKLYRQFNGRSSIFKKRLKQNLFSFMFGEHSEKVTLNFLLLFYFAKVLLMLFFLMKLLMSLNL